MNFQSVTKYRFQLTGIIEAGNKNNIPDITKALSERVSVPNVTLTGAAIHEMPEPKKRIGKKSL